MDAMDLEDNGLPDTPDVTIVSATPAPRPEILEKDIDCESLSALTLTHPGWKPRTVISDACDVKPSLSRFQDSHNIIDLTGDSGLGVNDMMHCHPWEERPKPRLAVDQMIGPAILRVLTNGYPDIPSFLHVKFRKLRLSSIRFHIGAEVEAETLGRMIHLDLLAYKTEKDAFEHCPSLEVGLRRLYAIFYVEDNIRNGRYRNRRDAWRAANELLETGRVGYYQNKRVMNMLNNGKIFGHGNNVAF